LFGFNLALILGSALMSPINLLNNQVVFNQCIEPQSIFKSMFSIQISTSRAAIPNMTTRRRQSPLTLLPGPDCVWTSDARMGRVIKMHYDYLRVDKINH